MAATPTVQRTGSAAYNSNLRTLVVGHGISIQGTIQDVERLVIEGTVEANLIQAKEFVIAQGGIFRGTVEVEIAEIGGTMDGDLKALNSLTLQATGRLVGKAACHRLQVEDGGQITGQLEMIPAAPPSGNKTTPSVTPSLKPKED
ncbi:polymer-forming cytoskeletal protein [Acetobacteraceae bacterium ESL0709]|nr:polymer-forming cytoskeletal protein [Acetobacteraceae bacterium ESL0697]MDF7677354.1 polymer-forming cytoskeletal protein [Acetobacteraceae bacterium ESL0709]